MLVYPKFAYVYLLRGYAASFLLLQIECYVKSNFVFYRRTGPREAKGLGRGGIRIMYLVAKTTQQLNQLTVCIFTASLPTQHVSGVSIQRNARNTVNATNVRLASSSQ